MAFRAVPAYTEGNLATGLLDDGIWLDALEPALTQALLAFVLGGSTLFCGSWRAAGRESRARR
jgi:hypothetical protein